MANKIWFIEDKDIKEYPGTYAEYEEWNSKRPPAAPSSIPMKAVKEEKPKPAEKPVTANGQQQLKKLNDQLQKTEQEIAELEKKVKAIETELAEVYSDQAKLADANKKYQAVKHLLDAAQLAWEDLAAEIMEMEGK